MHDARMTETNETWPIERLLAALWDDYVAMTPQAQRVHALLAARGDDIINDHIALRTFALDPVRLDVLARPFVACGYVGEDRYVFPEKKLVARHFRHPDSRLPKVFISELDVGAFSPALGATVRGLLAALPAGFTARPDFVCAGRPWQVDLATYRALLAESEYAAWVSAFGFRANHFTVDVGSLRSFAGLAELDQFLLDNGFALNDSGGLIKGTPAERLEQSSTRADEVEVSFRDGVHRVPSCYYEFARRYRLPNGELFHGFIAASADKLFESTDVFINSEGERHR
jgi:hypothetical protein